MVLVATRRSRFLFENGRSLPGLQSLKKPVELENFYPRESMNS
jgi:hypothetical protein